jgi:hypothetical protein
MKKLLVISLTLALLLSIVIALPAFAGNPQGNGKGLSTAPGQDDTFNQGITTSQSTSRVVTTGQDVAVNTVRGDVDSTAGNPVITTETSYSHGYYLELAPDNGQHAGEWRVWDNLTTTVTTTTTTTTDFSQDWTTTTTTTPWTKTDTTVTTTLRHGSPQGNGAVISRNSVTTTSLEYGAPVVTVESGIDTWQEQTVSVSTSSATAKVPVQWGGNQGWNDGTPPTF